ncbi:trypsin CFT-1-like [Plutella xylostella]|uniref:trypsin CFT-1-like n=1 Tax=Plutella xylostella TaxID=51655 RepID=UPI002032B7A8|nr:trypsin CFT-1-like [Plutella xylostella]
MKWSDFKSFRTMHKLVLLVLCGAAYALAAPGARIVGGQGASIEEYPFSAVLMYYWEDVWQPTCGGALVTRTTILSAATCYGFALPSTFSARVGSTSRVTGGTVVAAREFVFHPDYIKEMEALQPIPFDLVIVRVAPGIEYSTVIQPARIPAAQFPLPTGTALTALGWGQTTNNGSLIGIITEASETLKQVEVRVFDQQTCRERYSAYEIVDHMLCSIAVEGAGTCRGDSGGPVVLDGDVVVGINSWRRNDLCGNDFYPEISTKVSSFSEWIVENGSG